MLKKHKKMLIVQKQPPQVLYKKGAPKNFAIFMGKHLCWSLLIEKLQASTLFKKDSDTSVFQ